MSVDIRVPALGESVTEATIGQWFKKVGEAVAADEPVVELETDKVTIEVPAPAAGVLEAIAANPGDTVNVGALIGAIGGGDGKGAAAPAAGPAARSTTSTSRLEPSSPSRTSIHAANASGSAGVSPGGMRETSREAGSPPLRESVRR